MPREKPSYRDNLEMIVSRFPDKTLLTVTDVAQFCGVSRAVAKKLFSFDAPKNYISVAKLAREMS